MAISQEILTIHRLKFYFPKFKRDYGIEATKRSQTLGNNKVWTLCLEMSRLPFTDSHWTLDDSQVFAKAKLDLFPIQGRENYFYGFWVDPRFRGQHIGSLMFSYLLYLSHQMGLHQIWWLATTNEQGHAIYENFHAQRDPKNSPFPEDSKEFRYLYINEYNANIWRDYRYRILMGE